MIGYYESTKLGIRNEELGIREEIHAFLILNPEFPMASV
jgi:hypothetical protein